MSLFAGTSFLAGPSKKQDAPAAAEDAPSKAAGAAAGSSGTTAAEADGAGDLAGASAPAKPAGPAWSAALRFAPAASRKSAKAAQAGTSTVRTTLPSGFTAAPTSTISVTPPISARPHEVGFSAAPQLYNTAPAAASTSVPAADSPVVEVPTMDVNGKKIFRPPALTLPAGQKSQGAGPGRQGQGQGQGVKRPGQGQGEGGSRKRRKKKNRNEAPVHTFNPTEAYNPAQPNDLAEWREYRAARKAERREEEARRRAAERRGSDSEGSYYTEDEEDEDVNPKRAAQKGFAPPPTLYAPPPSIRQDASASSRPIYPEEEEYRPPPPPPAAPAIRPPMPQSGDDAWARRAAMSGVAPPPSAPAFAPAQAGSSFIRPPPQAGPNPAAPPAFVTSAAPAPPAAPSAPADTPEEFQRKLEERKAAAAAVAARLANIMGNAAVPVQTGLGNSMAAGATAAETDGSDQGGSFAEKMMRKMGYEEGKGLGREGTGIVHAFSAEHSAPGTSKPGKKASGWVQAKTAQGRLVNLNENEKEKQDKEKYGEPSRVVCLGNVVGGPQEIDDELSGEIAQECSNYGIVERVMVHEVQPPPPEAADRVRIYIVFSGLAGAWRAVKELDGRFFGGRSLRATYFNEIRFNRGDRDGPVLTR